MKIKQIPEDFQVDEIYSLETFKKKSEEMSSYDYYILKKKNYTTIRAVSIIAKIFNISIKRIHFAGTKDKRALTTQIISVYNPKNKDFSENFAYLNEKIEGIKLEYIGKFHGRVNLGDNEGNRFKIAIRDLDKNFNFTKNKLKQIEEEGILNYFDEQRFGYANNSHIIGKFVLKNQIEDAVREILCSIPITFKTKSLTENDKNLIKYVDAVKENWENIKESNSEIINKILEMKPKYLDNDERILNHLKKYKNDFPGAFRTIPKKLRTLYINAFQSYVFNETIDKLCDEKILNEYDFIELISPNSKYDDRLSKIINDLLEKEGLTGQELLIKHMPELKLFPIKRRVKIFPRSLILSDLENDELNPGKFKIVISFELKSGEYATNVIRQIFNNCI